MTLREVEVLPLERFLKMDRHDPEVVAANSAIDETRKPAKRRKVMAKALARPGDTDGEPTLAFEVEHLCAYTEAGIKWKPAYTEEFCNKTVCLTDRAKQVLWYEEQTRGFAPSLKGLHIRDLNMTLSWGRTRVNCTPCVVSTSKMWVRGRTSANTIVDRFMSGSELLNLQGIEFDHQGDQFTCKEKSELAGNAFNKAILYAVVTGLMTCVSHSSIATCTSSSGGAELGSRRA